MTDKENIRQMAEAVRAQMHPDFFLGEPGEGVLARVTGRIGKGGLAGTYCDCSTCACDACSCNCSCNACGACYCDCSCNDMTIVWRPDDLVSLAHVMTALQLPIGDATRIAEAIALGRK